MGAWWLMLRCELRRRSRAMAVIVLLVGISAAVTIGAATSARRTATAFERLLRHERAADLVLLEANQTGTDADIGMVPGDKVRSRPLDDVPGVATTAAVAGVLAVFPDVPGLRLGDVVNQSTPVISVITIAPLDARYGHVIDRPQLVAGRLPDPAKADEVLVSEKLAALAGWSVGERITMRWVRAGMGADQSLDPNDPADQATFTSHMGRTDLLVVGVGNPVPRDRSERDELVLLTPAFLRQPGVLAQYTVAALRLQPEADQGAVVAAATTRGFKLKTASSNAVASYRDSVRPDVVSRIVLAVVSAIVTLLVLGQLLAREARAAGDDNSGRRAIGASSMQLASVALARVAMVVVSGVGLGALAAAATSGWFLRDAAASVEPTPGVLVDVGMILVISFALTVALVGIAVAPPSVPRELLVAPSCCDRRGWSRRSLRPARLFRWWSVPAMPWSAGSVVQACPRTALALAAVGAAVAIGAVVFATGLDRLVADPPAYGVTWQLRVGANYDEQRDSGDPCRSADQRCGDEVAVMQQRMLFLQQTIESDPDVIAATSYSNETIEIDGIPVGVYAMDDGTVQPTITVGDRPHDGEIALGRSVMRSLGVRIGGLVHAGELDLRVVGEALLPDALAGESLGRGGVITAATAHRLDPSAMPRAFLVRTLPGADPALALARFRDVIHGEMFDVSAAQVPTQIGEYAEIRNTPVLLAIGVAAAGAGMIIAGIVSTVHRRRHEYALLQALGATRGQLRQTIGTQALTSVVIALLVGAPIGLVAGGALWRAFERRLGTIEGTVWPALTLLLGALAAVVLILVVVQPVAHPRTAAPPAAALTGE